MAFTSTAISIQEDNGSSQPPPPHDLTIVKSQNADVRGVKRKIAIEQDYSASSPTFLTSRQELLSLKQNSLRTASAVRKAARLAALPVSSCSLNSPVSAFAMESNLLHSASTFPSVSQPFSLNSALSSKTSAKSQNVASVTVSNASLNPHKHRHFVACIGIKGLNQATMSPQTFFGVSPPRLSTSSSK